MNGHVAASAAPPFEGLRVVEIANDPAGELTGRLLAQMGADVVKLEPPEGSASRRVGPFAGDVADPERSLAFWFYNMSKRSVVHDLRDDGLVALDALLVDADILLSTLAPRELGQLGLDFERLVARHPRLIVVSINNWAVSAPFEPV